MTFRRYWQKIIVSGIFLFSFGCQKAGNNNSDNFLASYPQAPATLRLNLTDKPLESVESVWVNIHHFELLLTKGGRAARLIAGQGTENVDLLTLQGGVLLPVDDLEIASGISVREVRLILNSFGNEVEFKDGTFCEMKTPSAQQSGVKIKLKKPILIESGYQYSLVVDFDAEKSVIVRGNGKCLLKPVIRLVAGTRVPLPVDEEDAKTPGEEESVVDGEDSNDGEWDDGSTDDSDVPVVEEEDALTL